MIIIQLTYKAPLSEVDRYLRQHREFLDYHYKQGLFLASGPINPRTGGIIIAASNDVDAVKHIFSEDPYQLAQIADYEFIEFTPVKHCDALSQIILNTEGKLC